MKHVMAVAALVLALAGCGGSSGEGGDAAPTRTVTADAEAIATPTTAPEPTPEPTVSVPVTSERGNIVKAVGETAGVMDLVTGNLWVEFQVTGIEVGGTCTADYVEPSENGQFLFVSLSMSTATEWPSDMQGVSLDFNPNEWSVIGADGLTENELATVSTYGCLAEGDLVPVTVGPGENVVGTVALDTANPSGVLVFKPWWGGGSGWEWTY